MAKIDVSKIQGYADMTPEEKLAVLEGYEVDDHASELAKLKEEMSKRNGEVANLKKQLGEKDDLIKAKMTDEEKAKAEREEELNKLREEVANLQKDKTTSEYKAQLISLGYTEELAIETAKAYADGDNAKVLENQKKFIESHDKDLKAELMKGAPTPPAGAGGETMTLEKLRKMPQKDRIAFANEHPEEYNKLYGKEE